MAKALKAQGSARGRGPRASLTCLVDSVQFPDVLIAAGGQDLDQAGFISACPLGGREHNKAQACYSLLPGTQDPPGHKPQRQATDTDSPIVLLLRPGPEAASLPSAVPGRWYQ